MRTRARVRLARINWKSRACLYCYNFRVLEAKNHGETSGHDRCGGVISNGQEAGSF